MKIAAIIICSEKVDNTVTHISISIGKIIVNCLLSRMGVLQSPSTSALWCKATIKPLTLTLFWIL